MGIWVRGAAAVMATTFLAGPAEARQPATPALRIRFETNPRLECHWYLRTYGKRSLKPDASSKVDFAPEAALYAGAASRIEDEAAWRWFEDLVIAGPDPAAIREAASSVPTTVDSPSTRAGINALVEAFTSAYPKFLDTVWPESQKGLSPFIVSTRKQFVAVEPRISEALMTGMAFMAIDAPITVFVVMRGGRDGTWGKVGSGYHVVVGQSGLSLLGIVEAGLHRVTHVLDVLQPYSSRSVLRQAREGLRSDAQEAVDTFLHGLIAHNAGALVAKFLARDYVPAGVRAPDVADVYKPYLPTYEFIWRDYLNGKIAEESIAPKLIEEFRAIRRLLETRR